MELTEAGNRAFTGKGTGRVLWRRKELAGHEKGTGGNTEKSFRDPLAVTGRGRIRWQLQFWIILAKKREGQQSISKMQFGTF